MTSGQYRNHHYVPQWYQRRFVHDDADPGVLFRLGLQPESLKDANGQRRELPRLRRQSIRKCFCAEDLYTLRFGDRTSTEIERLVFGRIDDQGSRAVKYWSDFQHPSVDSEELDGLLAFMSTQRLRTPKGIDWLTEQVDVRDRNQILQAMVSFRNLFAAIWCECVWQLADATESETKFIVTDHPVTVYNRRCGPRNKSWCRGPNDPDIRYHATHTLFPLDLNRILILTNLSWARDPYQSPTELRPNPTFLRDSFFNFFEVQTGRLLSEEEVLQINFILKSRAYRYVAASQREWLFPEDHVSKSHWADFGHGYLLMPDPRDLHHGGEIVMGYGDGSTDSFDAFGRKPWDPTFGVDSALATGRDELSRFKVEFEDLFGSDQRGGSFEWSIKDRGGPRTDEDA